MTKYEVCTRDNSMVEIKYLADKSLMGLCFCGDINKPYKIVSEDTLMVIAYSGYYSVDSIEMEYKAIPARTSINIEKN
uniref:Conserved domain protein n=1 Tax=Parastrongyloides trichosuri TaxID=131310 RepID=A0A0N4Z828_PARTI